MEVAPDLENGSIIHGERSANAWVTEIQAVLVEHRGEQLRKLYLAHECRKERLPFSDGPLGGGSDIFMRHKPYDFLTFTSGERFWELYLVDTLVAQKSFVDLDILQIEDSLFLLPGSRQGWHARPRCPEVPVTVHGWPEVRRGLETGGMPPRRLFCRFRWDEDGVARTLYFPARYVNFATGTAADAYLQPISGYVLVPFRDSYQAAYLACAITEHGRSVTEFLIPRYVDASSQLARRYGLDGTAPPFDKLRQVMPAYVRVFDWVRKVTGELTFFSYGQAA